ncbi:hypothetical protein IAT38_004755 [Cryptococcus sp. DSM 104549]
MAEVTSYGHRLSQPLAGFDSLHRSPQEERSKSASTNRALPDNPTGARNAELSDNEIDAVGIGKPSPRINPFHLISHPNSSSPLPPLPSHLQAIADAHDPETGAPPVHITRVTDSGVEVKPHQPDSAGRRGLLKKVSSVFKRDNSNPGSSARSETRIAPASVVMQGPPPSPPLSDDGMNGSVVMSDMTDDLTPAPHFNNVQEGHKLAIATRITAEPLELPSSALAPPLPTSRRVSSSSTSSRAGSLTLVRSGRLAPQRDADSGVGKGKDLPPVPVNADQELECGDSAGNLLAPVAQTHRRSTNPSPTAPPSAPRSPLTHSHSLFAVSPSPRFSTPVPTGLEGEALDFAILAQEENIRRERIERSERRNKKASATSDADVTAERAPPVEEGAAAAKERENTPQETKVLVGNLIGEDHVNYVLMYNMLTGIRIGVSRCQAKIKRPLTEDDYLARHKFSFDIVGNELTPSAKYDFKFKDYAPWVFRELRDEHFHLDPADYLLSLTAKYILSELGSPGKSGSFFYFSRDYRFIIKTISHSEHKFLRSILKDYHKHIKENPHTLISRFYGLHRVKLPRGPKIHFVIMNNLFPPHRDIHETYDLKGSAFGREYPEEKAATNPRAVLKDRNWVKRRRELELGPEKSALLIEQLRRDMEFLKKIRVMDYSLLVGIHNMERGNRDNLRSNQLTMFHPEVSSARRKPSTIKGPSEASNIRKAVRRSDPKALDITSQLPSEDSADRRHFLFYQDEGGLRATDSYNNDLDTIYYLGVIDICTPYNTLKKVEHLWKSMTEDRRMISCIEPVSYGQRFLNFMMSVIRGGDLSLRPEGLQAEPEPPKVSGSFSVPTAVPSADGTREGTGGITGEITGGGDINATGLESREVDGQPQRGVVGHLKAD